MATTDAAVATAAGAVNTKALGLAKVRELGKQKRNARWKSRHNTGIEDGGVAICDLDQDATARLAVIA